MSDSPRISNLSGAATISFRPTGTISASFAGTGRYVTCDSDYAAVSNWAQAPSPGDLIAHEACARFRRELSRIAALDLSVLQCLRGRTAPFTRTPPAADEMAPPPADRTDDRGRYNRRGESVLYLSDSEEGIRRELAGRQGPIWIQRFILRPATVRIADLRLNLPGTHRFMRSVLWFAELAGQQGYPGVDFSQTLAQIVGQRFDGMMVPGVRGDGTFTYHNIVLFRPESRWRAWLDGTDPYELD